MDFSDKLALIIAAISLAVLVFGIFIMPAMPVAEEENDTANITATEKPEIKEQTVWSLLNRENVEVQCLKQARFYAEKQGLPSFAVTSCKCSANETADVKSYDCSISSFDGIYKIDAKCVKKDERCIFTSIGGAIVYTFDEMEKMIID
jgi:hypothetical protein